MMYEKTYDRIFSNDKELLVDIIEDVIDKDMEDNQRQSLVSLLYITVIKGGWDYKYDTVRDICKKLEAFPDTLTEQSKSTIEALLKFVNE